MDIPVGHKVFDGFDNVVMMSNNDPLTDIGGMLEHMERNMPYEINKNTITSIGAKKNEFDL